MGPKMEVKCSVNNCHYWQSNFCHADRLQVDPDSGSEAKNSDETRCTTFKMK